MTITFNSDPKLQAQAMIEQFMPYASHQSVQNCYPVDIREPQWESPSTTQRKNAIACALIAAKMCRSFSATPTIQSTEMFNPWAIESYWSAVIEELEKA